MDKVTLTPRPQAVACTVPADEVKRVKGLGCLRDKRTADCFNVRVLTRNGILTADEQIALAQAAEKFGSGKIGITTRQTMEIQSVPYGNLEALFAFLKQYGLESGGTGPKVRPVVSCKGTSCSFGLIDTYGLSLKIHEKFYVGYHQVALPHKFKIGVGGCPNNCVKPDLNDFGVVGQFVPSVEEDKCRACAKCQIIEGCPIHAARMENGKVFIDPEKCNHCGRCVGKCPFKAVEQGYVAYKVTIGGRWGKKVAIGRPLTQLLTSEEQVLQVLERAILLFRDEGMAGERFSDTIERLGFEYVNDKLLSDL